MQWDLGTFWTFENYLDIRKIETAPLTPYVNCLPLDHLAFRSLETSLFRGSSAK